MTDRYSLDLSSVWRYRELLVSGLLVSGQVWVLALALGLVGGSPSASVG